MINYGFIIPPKTDGELGTEVDFHTDISKNAAPHRLYSFRYIWNLRETDPETYKKFLRYCNHREVLDSTGFVMQVLGWVKVSRWSNGNNTLYIVCTEDSSWHQNVIEAYTQKGAEVRNFSDIDLSKVAALTDKKRSYWNKALRKEICRTADIGMEYDIIPADDYSKPTSSCRREMDSNARKKTSISNYRTTENNRSSNTLEKRTWFRCDKTNNRSREECDKR